MAQSNVAPLDQAVVTDCDNCNVTFSCSNRCSVDTFPRPMTSISPCTDWGRLLSNPGRRRYITVGVTWLRGQGNTATPCRVVLTDCMARLKWHNWRLSCLGDYHLCVHPVTCTTHKAVSNNVNRAAYNWCSPSLSVPRVSLLRRHSCVLTDGIHEIVGGPASTATSDIVFHPEVGASIQLSNSRRTARRVRSYQYYCFSWFHPVNCKLLLFHAGNKIIVVCISKCHNSTLCDTCTIYAASRNDEVSIYVSESAS